MTAEPSNARGEVVAWFPTNAQGEIIRNYGDGSPVYACRTKEEAEQAKRCHLGATGPVIPLYTAPPPAAARGDVRGLVAKLAAHVRPTCSELWDEAQAFLAALSQQPDAKPFVGVRCPECNAEYIASAAPEARGVVDSEPERQLIDAAAGILNDRNGKIGKKKFRGDAAAVVRRIVKALTESRNA